MSSYRPALALSMSILVSSEVQVLLGNGMGMVGWFFPLCLLAVVALHLLTLQAYHDIYGGVFEQSTELGFLSSVFGRWLPLLSSLASRVVFMVCAATISLVTAGFVFNEVFVYWFANFGFAFLMLGLVLLVQLAGRQWVLRAQTFLVLLALVLVAVLVVIGLGKGGTFSVQEFQFQGRGVLLPFFMVVGVEFYYLAGRSKDIVQNQMKIQPLVLILISVLVLYSLWGIVMSFVVDPAKLARSFNPQMLSARHILGQPGRLIMGAALLAGGAALVNGLFYIVRVQLSELLPFSRASANTSRKKLWTSVGVIALAAVPALMMVSGMAGEEVIDVYVRVALVCWLVHYGLIHFAMFFKSQQRKGPHLGVGIIFLGASIALGWTDPEPIVFLKSLAMIVLSVGAISLFIIYFRKKLTHGG